MVLKNCFDCYPWIEEWYWNTTIFNPVNNPSELWSRMTGWQKISNVESKVFLAYKTQRVNVSRGSYRRRNITKGPDDFFMAYSLLFPTSLKLKTDLYRLNKLYLRIQTYKHTYMNTVTIKTWVMNLKSKKKEYMQGFEGMEGKGEMF